MHAAIIFGFVVCIYVDGVDSVLPVGETTQLCVPTDKSEGPRHICVCGIDGVYHCKRRENYLKDHTELGFINQQKQCEPNVTYQEQNLICTCNEIGDWRSDNCYQNFRFMKPRDMENLPSLRSRYSCMSGKMYLVDCNICSCDSDGYINTKACSTRSCTKGHKIDKCTHGDILRTIDELCTCSDINVYIDRQCVSITEHRVQRVQPEHFDILITSEKNLRTLPVFSDRCTQTDMAEIDCNTCYCIAGAWACTNKKCDTTKRMEKLRNRKKTFLNLPEVFSEKESCIPFKKYRYKCNTCICTKKRSLSCTSMICLEALLGNAD